LEARQPSGFSEPAGPYNSSSNDQDVELLEVSAPDKSSQHADSALDRHPRKAFTLQAILQIISVSFLAFHKVSSDAIMPVFLAAPSNSTDPETTLRGEERFASQGFGYSSQKIGLILLSQAIVAVLVQARWVPYFISKYGALRSYQMILCICPTLYLFTPFLPLLTPPLALITVVLELWLKVILSSIAYICSAML
jgi:hypothetical protein